jgi:hypothetical protein
MAKATADIRSLARAQTGLAIRTLTGICGSKAAPAAARVMAANSILDRGWGRPAQVHSGEDGGSIQVIIRQIADITGEAEPVLIEHGGSCDEA